MIFFTKIPLLSLEFLVEVFCQRRGVNIFALHAFINIINNKKKSKMLVFI